jgi:hypothetical protein
VRWGVSAWQRQYQPVEIPLSGSLRPRANHGAFACSESMAIYKTLHRRWRWRGYTSQYVSLILSGRGPCPRCHWSHLLQNGWGPMKADSRNAMHSSSTVTLACEETTRHPLQDACVPLAALQGNPAIGGGLESISESLGLLGRGRSLHLTQGKHSEISSESRQFTVR